MSNVKEMTCIICPNSCNLAIALETKKVEGALCKRGEVYALSEVTKPLRNVTTTIKVINGELPLASVKTSKPIDKHFVKDICKEIAKQQIEAPVYIGQVLFKDFMNSGIDIIATKTVSKNVFK